jgi:glutathione synthase/RimK-type ligase-like ATP-grasp enzyme
MPVTSDRPIAILYEHPDWFRPLFKELDRRGTPYEKIHAGAHRFDPAEEPRYSLVFNRMSPSAWLRGNANAIFYTQHYLAHLAARGVRVVNGHAAFRIETSKAGQLTLLEGLGLKAPRSRVIHDPGSAVEASGGLRFPVIVKPNVGGSGAGVRRFNTLDQLRDAALDGGLDFGIDGTALVQEFIPQKDGRIVRVEVLGGCFLYAIRIYTPGDSFNLCPGDVCRTVGGEELVRAACPVDAPKNDLRVEGYLPPPQQIDDVERIARAAGIDVGGVEYFVDERDDRLYYYDINALSNFVADAPRVVGFDPFERLADYLEQEAR